MESQLEHLQTHLWPTAPTLVAMDRRDTLSCALHWLRIDRTLVARLGH